MSPSATGVAARRHPARRPPARRPARRRSRAGRRLLLALGVLGVLGLGAVALAPVFKRAVRDFTLPLAYQDIIREQAADKHLPPALVAAVIYAETKFDPRSSPAGAEGLMQIMPQTALFLAKRSGATNFTTADLATPSVNIAYGSYYLRYLLDEYHGSKVLALAAYNGGEANVDRWILAARASGQSLTIAAIPFPETRAYVEKVLTAEQRYRSSYATQLGYR